MLNRSWVFGIFYLFAGYSAYAFGVDAISIDPPCDLGEYDNCLGPYNKELMDKTKDIMVIAVHVLLTTNIFLVIACYKWRWLAAFQIYFVLLSRVFFCFVPTAESRGMHPFLHCVNAIVLFIACYCGSVWNIYSLLITTCIELSFGVYIGYDRPYGPKEIILTTFYAIITFWIIAAFGAAFEQVSELYTRLDFTNAENIKLLNGMHEGVLILSKPTT